MDRVNAALKRIPPWTIYLVAAVWASWLFWQAVTGTIGVDPVRELEYELGIRALQLLILGLAVTPLRRFVGLNLMLFRRAIGVTAFALVALHLMTWLAFDIGFDWARAWADVLKRPFITIGMGAFVMLLPLAATSNNLSIRKLGGAAWRRLHKLSYPAGIAGGLHYLLLVKSWPLQPIVYCGIIAGLLALRLVPQAKARRVVPAKTAI